MKFNWKVSIKNILKGLFYSCIVIAISLITLELPLFNKLKISIFGKSTVQKRVQEIEPKVTENLKPLFVKKNVAYPPDDVTLLFIKSQKILSLFATDSDGNPKLIKTYKVFGASGKSGPKLTSGDNQVPEGMYRIESLNPNSQFHLALRINYPSDFDKKMAKEEGRKNLGSDIMIHGSVLSIGCIAIGDDAVEELFYLAAQSNYRTWKVILSPVDFRKVPTAPDPLVQKPWIPKLYEDIAQTVKVLPLK
jgi:murein L,D-transpeptidase YafK